jgi:type II secretory pathway component GspD/PulD (secretin)
MNKIKILIITLLAGPALLQPVFPQPAATMATTNSALYNAMVSNALKFSTGTDEPPVPVATATVVTNETTVTTTISNPPPAPAVSNEPAAAASVSNVMMAPAASNPPASTVVATTVRNATVVSAGSNPTPTVVVTTVSNKPSPVVSVTNVTVVPSASNNPGMVVTTTVSNEPSTAAAVSNVTVASADSNETGWADTTNVTSSDTDTNNPPAASTDTNVIVENTIRFQDIPITSVIENLARQAGINYLLDPRIGYGQVDPATGQTKAEPSLSLRWENITPEQALVAVLDNYGLQLVVDPKTKIAKVTIKDPAAPPPLVTRVYQLAYASVTIMEGNVTTALTDKRSRVVSDSRTSQLIVVATDPEQTDVAALIQKLDKPTRQVLIETRFIEISSNPTTTKGVDWTGTLQAQAVTFGNGTYSQVANAVTTAALTPATTTSTLIPGTGRSIPITTPAGQTVSGNNTLTTVANSGSAVAYSTTGGFNPAAGFLTANGLNVVLSFLNTSSDAQVVSTPRIVTLDNEQATIAVTRAFPIFQTTAGTQGSPGGSSITYSNVGIVLQVTPHISANDYIWMKVNPSISTFYATVTKTVAGEVNQADEFDSRNIDTQVLIPNANTLVMGGMVKDNPNSTYTKVPLLGDIPVLGYAFRSENKSMDKQNLLIFITPTIIKDSDFQPTTTTFMNSRPIKEQEPLDPNSAWDSGKPHDWSDPKNTDPTQVIINQKTTE